MPEKPSTAAGYPPNQVSRIKAACLYIATKLGDLMPDLVVVGGLAPSLLIDQENLQENTVAHVGTMDLDLGLAFALVGEQRYQEVAQRLRSAGFTPDRNETTGQPTRQRWRIGDPAVTVDFLIEPENGTGKPGGVFPLAGDWAAIIAPGLHLAFQNNHMVTLRGRTIQGEKVGQGRDVRVCGAGAFVVLKALAFHFRGENKDAYDLFYLLGNYGLGVPDVAAELRPLLADTDARKAMNYLRGDFESSDFLGPRRVAQFLYGRPDAVTQADAAGFVRQLFLECEA